MNISGDGTPHHLSQPNPMPKASQEVHHCPSCGALAEARADQSGEKVCGKCGCELRPSLRIAPRSVALPSTPAGGFVQRDVSSRRRLADKVEAAVTSPESVLIPEAHEQAEGSDTGYAKQEVVSDDGHKRVVRRRKKRRRTQLAPLLFVCVWTVAVMGLIILVRSQMRPDEPVEENAAKAERRQVAADVQHAADIVNRHLPACAACLNSYVQARAVAERAQFIRDRARILPIMTEYYNRNPPYRPSAKTEGRPEDQPEGGGEESAIPKTGQLHNEGINLFLRRDLRAIETIWKDELDHRKEVVFVEDDEGKWVIDWEFFTNYSSEPWVDFLKRGEPDKEKGEGEEAGAAAAAGEDLLESEAEAEVEAEFRIYFRVHTATSGLQNFALVFYPYRPGDPAQSTRLHSPTALVPRESESGRRIQHILDEAGRPPKLGDSMFGRDDPKNLHRVRVKLAWQVTKDGETKNLKVKSILAGNWYGAGFEDDFPSPDDPGEEDLSEESPATTEGETEEDERSDSSGDEGSGEPEERA